LFPSNFPKIFKPFVITQNPHLRPLHLLLALLQIHLYTMTNTVSNTEYSSLSTAPSNNSSPKVHSGTAIPVEVILRCANPHKCEADHLTEPDASTTSVVRLPLDSDMKMQQLTDQLLDILEEDKFGMQDHLKCTAFADHALYSFRIYADWETDNQAWR
jgi:hypothetical protein